MDEACQVLTTTATREDAQRLARTVLERRVAACVQVVGPVESRYWWNGALETSREWLCIIKTTRRAYPALERVLREVHPYEVPEITALPVVEGSADYLAWIAAEVPGPKLSGRPRRGRRSPRASPPPSRGRRRP